MNNGRTPKAVTNVMVMATEVASLNQMNMIICKKMPQHAAISENKPTKTRILVSIQCSYQAVWN